MKFACKWDGSKLIPFFNSGYDKTRKLKVGQLYECEVKQPRNLKFHRKFFALLNLAYDNQDFTDNFDRFRQAVMIEAGFSETIVNKQTGEVHVFPKSISFSKMSEEEFEVVYDKVHDYICRAFSLPEDVEAELINFL